MILLILLISMEKKFEGNTFNLAYQLMSACFTKCNSFSFDNYNDECVSTPIAKPR